MNFAWQVEIERPLYVYWRVLCVLHICSGILGDEALWFLGVYGPPSCFFRSHHIILYIQVCFYDLSLFYYCMFISNILSSDNCRFARVGSVILALHDATDVFMEVGKMSKYSGAETLASCSFVIFVILWILLRLIYYPFWVLWSTRSVLILWLRLPDHQFFDFLNNCKMFCQLMENRKISIFINLLSLWTTVSVALRCCTNKPLHYCVIHYIFSHKLLYSSIRFTFLFFTISLQLWVNPVHWYGEEQSRGTNILLHFQYPSFLPACSSYLLVGINVPDASRPDQSRWHSQWWCSIWWVKSRFLLILKHLV